MEGDGSFETFSIGPIKTAMVTATVSLSDGQLINQVVSTMTASAEPTYIRISVEYFHSEDNSINVIV